MNRKTSHEAKMSLISAGMKFCSRKSTINDNEHKSSFYDCRNYFSSRDAASSSLQSRTYPTTRKLSSLDETGIFHFSETASPKATKRVMDTVQEKSTPRRCRKISMPARYSSTTDHAAQSHVRAKSLPSFSDTVVSLIRSRNESQGQLNRDSKRSPSYERNQGRHTDEQSSGKSSSLHLNDVSGQTGPCGTWPRTSVLNDDVFLPDNDSRKSGEQSNGSRKTSQSPCMSGARSRTSNENEFPPNKSPQKPGENSQSLWQKARKSTITPPNNTATTRCRKISLGDMNRPTASERWSFVRSNMETKIFQSFIEGKSNPESEKGKEDKLRSKSDTLEEEEDAIFQEFCKMRFIRRNAICEISEQERAGLKVYLNFHLSKKNLDGLITW